METLFPYQPLMRYYYEGADHAKAIGQFSAWAAREVPGFHSRVNASNPGLLNPGRVVSSGMAGLSGLGNFTTEGEQPLTSWGGQVMDLLKTWTAYDTQRDLIKLNISRAERGLPPISGATIAPQVNIGASSELQTLGFLAVGALVLIGVLRAFKRR